MKKKERQELVLELLKKETPEADIVSQVVQASGAKEQTVLKDIKELSATETEDDSEETPEADIEAESDTIVIDLPRARKGEKFTYELPEKDRDKYAHVYQEKVHFNSDSGQRTSKGSAQVYGRAEWDNFRQYGPTLGYSIVPLHIPEGWSDEIGAPLSSGTVRVERKPEPKK